MPRPRTAGDYQDGITTASRSGLAEVMITLGAYREALVLIGGWAPYLILEQSGEQRAFQADAFQGDAFQVGFVHVGSIDIDLVVDPGLVNAEAYATIVELLLDRGYKASGDSLFQFEKTIRSARDGQDYLIRVDFLTPMPLVGQGKSHRHRPVQRDLKARTLEGVEVALTHWFWYELEAQLPDGAQARVRLMVADLVASLALKGIAIGERYAEKDAYDIYALCAHYSGGPKAVAAALKPYLGEEPVRRGLRSIAEKFRATDAEGPTWVSAFMGGGDVRREAQNRRDAFMTVQEVCRLLGLVSL
ncbi:MAG: hypothetical protein HY581_07065 [Nitrospirae bacterium]|nr:hypothetical protein [Nitrospirota bacterium]